VAPRGYYYFGVLLSAWSLVQELDPKRMQILVTPRAGSQSPFASAQHMRSNVAPKPAKDLRVVHTLDIINCSPCTASVLARSVNLSVSWFQHLFKSQTGMPLRQYVVSHRLQRAAKLLEETEMPVKEVAYDVGYRHPASFVRAFRTQFAVSPKLYRQRTRQLKR